MAFYIITPFIGFSDSGLGELIYCLGFLFGARQDEHGIFFLNVDCRVYLILSSSFFL